MNTRNCRRTTKQVVIGGAIFLALVSGLVVAQTVTTIKTDTSWDRTAQTLTPSSSNTVVTGNRGATYSIPGNVYTITEAQGKLSGANLFHSFESFSIGTGDAAVFTTTTPTLNNVVSRVSGMSPTTINGLLALVPAAGSNPNFFFVNPNGITFGAGAQVDVPAAFHVSTANSLRMGDTVFKAGNGSDSTLTIAAPEAFGFLGRAASAAIRVDNRDANGVPSGITNISGIGGRLTLTADDVQFSSATISVPNGGALLAATGRNPLEINLDGTSTQALSGAIAMTNATLTTSGASSIRLLGGPMSLTEGSRIASNQGAQSSAGSIALESTADIILARGFVHSFTSGSNAGSSIVLDAAGQIAISRGGQITSITQSSAPGGSISLRGKSVSMDGLQQSTTSTGIISQAQAGLGNTGPISIRAVEDIRVQNGGVVSASTFSSGSTGPIDVEAASLTIDGRSTPAGFSTGIFNSAFGGTGNAGDIHVDVGGLLTILGGGQLGSLIFSSGSGGSVSVGAGRMIVDGQSNPLPFITGVFAQTFSSGNAGSLQVRVDDDLTLVNGGQIVASTSGRGSTGQVEIAARTLTVNENVSTALFTGVFNSALKGSSGNAGDINVNVADRMSLLNEGQVSSITESTGSAGNVNARVTNGSLMIDGPGTVGTSGIFSNASQGASGDSGDVTVTVANQLSVVNHGVISSSTWGGSAGTVKVEAASLLLDAGSIDSQANPGSTGNAGNISVNVAGHISLLNGGEIATNTFSMGSAGNIDVMAGSMLMDARGVTGFVGGVLSRALNEEKFGTSSGNAGDIRIQVGGNLSIFSSEISSSTRSVGHAGTVDVTAGSLLLDNVSGIFSQTFSGFHPISQFGNAGTVKVKVADSLSILGGSRISSNTSTNGNGGSVSVSAQTLLVAGADSAISTSTEAAGQGGNVLISAGQMTVEQLANVTAETSGKGKAGNVTMTGDSLAVMSGGRIEASTSGEGRGGSIAVSMTGDVTVSGVNANAQTDNRSGLFAKTQSPSTGTGGGGGGGGGGTGGGGTGGGGTGGGGTGGGGGTAAQPGSAGNIAITAKNLLLNDGAQIDSSTTSGGAGGSVSITTTENITIAGSSTSLRSDATRGNGPGGNITLVAKNITVNNGASVTAATGGKGDAGNITLTAVDQLLLQSGGKVTTSTSGNGKGGSVVIQAGRVLVDGPDTAIIADTLRPFADLTITINILHANDGDLVVQLDSPTGTRVALLSRVGGSGDNFTGTGFNDQATNPITSGSAPFTGTFTPREPLAQLINEMTAGDWILSVRDQATGNVGTLQNWTLKIGQETFQSTGAPSQIPDNGNRQSRITVTNPNQQTVQGTGEAKGIGGDVTVNAGNVTVQNGATMSAITRGSGKGGTVNLQVAGDVSVSNNGRIATDTLGSGQAGSVLIGAQNLLVNRGEVSSGAQVGSSGQAGSLMVESTNAITLSNSGLLSIRNDAQAQNPGALTPTLLSVSAHDITLKDSKITAESTGNVAASDIQIHFTGILFVDPSHITTSANLGNGGDITIGGGQLIQLENSQITTSVGGGTGNGGDINIQAGSLVLNTGFIQANTAAAGASGGNVSINVQTLLPSGNSLTIGGSEPAVFQPGVFGLNVIQAAAPTGVSGTIHSTVPTLDVAANLSGLTAKVINFGALGKDLCRMGARSSFTPVGRGGLRPSSTGMIRPEGALAQTTASEAATGGHVAIADMRDGPRLGALAECRY